MQIRSKVIIVSAGFAAITATTLALLFISLNQIAFYQRNVQFSGERLHEYMHLKNSLLRAYKEAFDLQQTTTLGLTAESELNKRQLAKASQDVESSLLQVADTNERHHEFFAASHFVIPWGDEGVSVDDSAIDARFLNEASRVAHGMLAKLATLPQVKTVDGQLKLSLEAELLYDNDLARVVKSAIDDERNDERRNFGAIARTGLVAGVSAVGLTLVTLIFSGYLVFSFARPLARNLDKIMDGVNSFTHSRTMVHVHVKEADELGALAGTFNNMVKEIVDSHAALIASSKLSALGEMAGNIAHEINNPLGIITMRASQTKHLLKHQPQNLAGIQKSAEAIEATALRIAAIVNGLRSFSRNAEKDAFNSAPLATMIRDSIALCGERFKNHGIDLTVEAVDASLQLECRATQVVQVLVNLLNNAHDAVESLPKKWVSVSLSDLGDAVELAITDSGSGIPAEVADKIFQPFFTTKEVGKGTGLGLSISRGIIADHHGSLSVDKACANTRLLLKLPKSQLQPEAPRQHAA